MINFLWYCILTTTVPLFIYLIILFIVDICKPLRFPGTQLFGVFNLCQHFEISYSRYANIHFITGVYITINDSYR